MEERVIGDEVMGGGVVRPDHAGLTDLCKDFIFYLYHVIYVYLKFPLKVEQSLTKFSLVPLS